MKITENIYWVGAVDWDIRNFHGYSTPRGSSYNAYLIIDDKITLIDGVKEKFSEEMFDRIRGIIDPARIDYIVSNHAEMDHSGSFPALLEIAPAAEIITSVNGEKNLKRHFKKNWKFKVVKSGETLSIGKRTLSFIHTPMLHWPDNMVTYSAQDKILFSNDAFGQHIASAERYDYEIGRQSVCADAQKYYANILMPFSGQVRKTLPAVSALPLEMICPSHGVIWKKFKGTIIKDYGAWSAGAGEKKAVIVYDTMWGSTKKMALALEKGISSAGIPVTMRSLKASHISDVMSDILTARLVLIGSPTLNNGELPSIGAFLTYMKGLKPLRKAGFAFGSYGWAGKAAVIIESLMKEMGWDVPEKNVNVNFVPDENELNELVDTGRKLGEMIEKE
ncbi:MAG: FprA family A-type flavoprotein [Elusimicrobiota bacterium]|nr:FprA family A-type flavoprotein [Elusimicrobiota bacterium]